MVRMQIAGRQVGAGHPLFAIAEIGLNHSGSLSRALEMVDAAADAGASAVKLQTLEAASLVAPSCPAPAHVDAESLSDFFATFELDEAAHAAVAERTRARGLAFISTPFSLESVDLLNRVGVDAFKIASGDLHLGRLDRAGRRDEETAHHLHRHGHARGISHALATARLAGATEVALLHCVSAYPNPRGAENLKAIDTLARAFDTPVGLSDHGADTFAVPIAIACGASVYERHFMLDGDADAIDGPVSSTPAQFADLVRTAARALETLGSGEKRCEPAEAPNLTPSRRALYLRRPLSSGALVDESDLVALRPGQGIPANRMHDVVGRRLVRDVAAGVALQYQDVEGRFERRTA
ncbi:MAG: N-acetylneuraminate synthase family protein [Vicinamibacterales bacterium]